MRVEGRYPAGTIRIHDVAAGERAEVRRMIANVLEREREEHPLERVMDVVDEDANLVVTTTGLHAARCVADALKRRYKDGVTIRYGAGPRLVTVVVAR
jgi:hypothetical protein